jgi:hypothetical protein
MAVPGGQQTRGEIIESALTRVGNNTPTLQQAARVRLNRILAELYLNWDWPFLYATVPVALTSAGSVPLPAGFLKAQDDWALTITRVGDQPARRRLSEVDRMTFEQHRPTAPGYAMPRMWHADRSTGSILYAPIPLDGCQATFRYKFLPPDMPVGDAELYDDDIPIFAYANYLSDALLEWAMGYESDPRQFQQKADNAAMFQTIRGAAFPTHSVFPLGPGLDPDVFGRPWGGGSEED